jgi:hypothetical protein
VVLEGLSLAEAAEMEAGDGRVLTPMAGEAWDALVPALERLDALLLRAVEGAREVYGIPPGGDQFRGLYVSDADVDRAFERRAGEPLLFARGSEETMPATGPLARLAEAFGLTDFDLDVVLLALAPALDRRYERLYGYLQDNVARQFPTVDLALNLLCADAAERMVQRSRFAARAPLVANGVVRLVADASNPSLLAASLQVGPETVALLTGEDPMESWTCPGYRVVREGPPLSDLPLNGKTVAALAAGLERLEAGASLVLHLHGPDFASQERAAAAIAAASGRPLAMLDLAAEPPPEAVGQLLRTARLSGAAPFVAHCELLEGEQRPGAHELAEALSNWEGVALVGCRDKSLPFRVPVIALEFGVPGAVARRGCWERSLGERGLVVDDEDLDALSGSLRLTPEDIEGAVATALARAEWEQVVETGSAEGWALTVDGLFEAARGQRGHDLGELARQVQPHASWDDLVLPPDTLLQLREICERVWQRTRVLDEWGFDARLTLGKGTTVLFSGPAGTGKTMAAEVLGRELRLDLYKVDLSGVVSKYIGETEKNLGRIFAAAEDANAILFFDEADALFGKRSEVRDSHDRYANIEISYLLQKMEEYDGVAILATNLRQNLDESFVRRLAFSVHFPFPDEAARQEIWLQIWPAETPVGADFDAAALSRAFRLSGGNIKNVALAAAFSAAANGGVVRMEHVLHATRREFQKLGKSLSEAELALDAAEVGS